MSLAFESIGAAVSGTADHADWTISGSASGELLVAVFAFENVNVGSGPWLIEGDVAHSPPEMCAANGWERVLYEEPSANGGNGLEVWVAYWRSGTGGRAVFDTTRTFVMRVGVYAGQFDPGGTLPFTQGTVRASTKQQWTGDNPECPSVYTFERERVLAVAADQLQSPGYGTPTPSGWSSRGDSARGGTFGNVEMTLADKLTTIEGATGAIPFAATASSGATKGATATLAIRPADAIPVATAPLIAVEYAVPF